MSFEPPAGILDIGNATLRVGKLEVAETSGLNQGLQNIVKNDLLITESTMYTSSQNWGLKLPTTWVAEFDLKGETGKYVEFNFYNEGFTSNTSGYTLNFTDTSLTIKYDNGTTLASATIPTIVGTFRKVHIFFERNVIAVSIDGTRYLYDKRPSVLSRVISTTGSAFLNLFVEDNSNASLVAFKNLRIVNGRFISDETSNIAFVGGNLGVGVHSPTESLDVLGSIKTGANVHVTGNVYAEGEIELYSNLNIQHVSNTASIKLNSNVVTEFPRSKKLIKYPRVAMTGPSAPTGYVASASDEQPNYNAWKAFENLNTDTDTWATDFSENRYDVNTGEATTNTPLFEGERGDWIQIQLPTKIKIEYIVIDPRHVAHNKTPEASPGDGRIFGSTDGTNWTLITSFSGRKYGGDASNENASPETIFTSTNVYYNYYRLQVTKRAGQFGIDKYVAIGQLEYFGVPEYDPDAAGIDVKVTSYPNVPNTDWLGVYYDAKNLVDGSTTVNDLTPSGTNDGTANGNLSVSDGAFTFDGSGDYISTSITTSMTIHTASMWIQFDSPAAWECVYAIGPSSSLDRNNFNLYVNSDYFRLESVGNTGPYFDFLYDFEIGKWVHLTLVFRGTGLEDCEMYINNERLTPKGVSRSSSDDITITGTNNVYIGSDINTSYYHDGKIANFRLFNRVLSSDEIYQLYAYQKKYFGHGDLSMTLKAGRLGIGTSEPRAALDVRGNITGGCPVYFSVQCSSNAAEGIIPWDTVRASRGGGFNTTTGIFTVPLSGVYTFAYALRERNSDANLATHLVINGVDDYSVRTYHRSNYSHGSITFIKYMTKGDTIGIKLVGGDMQGSSYNQFTGQYISSV